MTLRAWIITLRGRVREMLFPEFNELRDQLRIERAKNGALSAQLRWTEAEAREWKAIANFAIKRANEIGGQNDRPRSDADGAGGVGGVTHFPSD